MKRHRSPDVHLNLNVRGLGESATLKINETCQQIAREGREVFRLGLGQSPFPVPRSVVEALQANAHQKDYLPVRGLRSLREAVAEFHRRRNGIEFSAEDVLVGPGSKELMFILQLVYYGDLVIPTPTWVSYAPQAHIIGRQIRWVPTQSENAWRLMPEELENLCRSDPTRPRILIVNYPSNPTGGTYRREELKALARVARAHKVVLLSDEIYGELHHKGQHVSIARYYPEGTIVSSGLSKWCGAGGWRIGTFCFPPSLRWLLDAMAVVASETFTATSTPIQHAAIRAFEGGLAIERYLVQSRRILSAIGRGLTRDLTRAGVLLEPPKGAFYLFCDFEPFRESLAGNGIFTSDQLCLRLLQQTGVALLPGSVFGRPQNELTARLAYVDFDGAQALAQAEQIPPSTELNGTFLKNCCDKLLRATLRLCDWLHDPALGSGGGGGGG